LKSSEAESGKIYLRLSPRKAIRGKKPNADKGICFHKKDTSTIWTLLWTKTLPLELISLKFYTKNTKCMVPNGASFKNFCPKGTYWIRKDSNTY
jgi:hypothetical protein